MTLVEPWGCSHPAAPLPLSCLCREVRNCFLAFLGLLDPWQRPVTNRQEQVSLVPFACFRNSLWQQWQPTLSLKAEQAPLQCQA